MKIEVLCKISIDWDICKERKNGYEKGCYMD